MLAVAAVDGGGGALTLRVLRQVDSNDALTLASFPALTHVGGTFSVRAVVDACTAAPLPLLTALQFFGNPKVCNYCSFCALAKAMPALKLDAQNERFPLNSTANWQALGQACQSSATNAVCDRCASPPTPTPTPKKKGMPVRGGVALRCRGAAVLTPVAATRRAGQWHSWFCCVWALAAAPLLSPSWWCAQR